MDHGLIVKKNIEIDDPGPARDKLLAAKTAFNPMQPFEQLTRFERSFRLDNGQITFRELRFGVTGATVQLAGTYGLRDEKLDFHGTLRLKAKLSEVTTGFKSLLLKPFDSFFRRNGVTVLPIKVTGTRDQPSFGLDFHHKKEDSKSVAGD